MIAKIICFASAKGGAGKTVLAASFGNFLAAIGKKVLLVDMDAATNGLSLLYLNELVDFKNKADGQKRRVLGVFEPDNEGRMADPFQIAYNLRLIPASYKLRQTEGYGERQLQNLLRNLIQFRRNEYDYIIFDAQAGSDIYAKIAIEAADYNIIVSEYDPVSAEGVERLKRIFSDNLRYDNSWILLNKVLPEFSSSTLSEFLSIFRYLNPIPWNKNVVQAIAKRKLALDTQNGNTYTIAIMRCVQSLLGSDVSSDIEQWAKEKASSIKNPATTQLEQLEHELKDTQDAKIEVEYELKRRRNRSRFVSQGALLVIVGSISAILYYSSVVRSNPLEYIVVTLVGTSLIVGIFGLLYFEFFSRSSDRIEKRVLSDIESLNLRIEDLQRERQQLKIIASSDLESLMKSKESTS